MILKKSKLNQRENLEGGGRGWSAFLGGMALSGVCTFVGIAAGAATFGAGVVAGFACTAVFGGLNAFNT